MPQLPARELLGGNRILLDNHIGRFVADAKAIYSYEGTREINMLIVLPRVELQRGLRHLELAQRQLAAAPDPGGTPG
jgi:hypothetical protein